MGEEGGGGDGRSKEGFFEKVKDEDDFKGSRLDFQFLTFLLAFFFFFGSSTESVSLRFEIHSLLFRASYSNWILDHFFTVSLIGFDYST